jgi:hypothetical protein
MTAMPPPDAGDLIRRDFRRQSGLRITASQAARLWNLDPASVERTLDALVDAKFLDRGTDGRYGLATLEPRSWLRRIARPAVLGWFVLAHAFAHAVLPMRGSIAPGPLIGDWTPAVLYIVSMTGFLVAALGLIGARRLMPAISPLLVVSSVLSLVAISRLGDAGLWIGAAGDLVFLPIGLWRGYAGWPITGHAHGRVWRTLSVVGGIALVAYVGLAAALWPWHRTWGSSESELAMALPGDPTPRHPMMEIQHAVTIDGPPEAVWPWLVQLGQDRAGFYSYDWLERSFGVRIHNAAEIRPEWQSRAVGDFVRATQPGYLGGLFGNDLGWRVTAVEPNRAMVLEHWGAFVLLPTEDGRTRFIIRSTTSNPAIPAWAAAVDLLAFQLPHFIMERRMMLTIKERAESTGVQRVEVRSTVQFAG